MRKDFHEEFRFECLREELNMQVLSLYEEILERTGLNSFCLFVNENGICKAKMISFADFDSMQKFFDQYYPDLKETAKQSGVTIECMAGSLLDTVDYNEVLDD